MAKIFVDGEVCTLYTYIHPFEKYLSLNVMQNKPYINYTNAN